MCPHDPIFSFARGHGGHDVSKLDREPVEVEQRNGRQGEPDATNSENLRVSLAEEVYHAACEEESPYTRPTRPPNADAVEIDLRFRIRRSTEFGAHGEKTRQDRNKINGVRKIVVTRKGQEQHVNGGL